MICSHCGFELQVNQSSCSRCGFVTLKSFSERAFIEELPMRQEQSPLLSRGRYQLTEKYGSQQWSKGAYEIHWFAQDLFQQHRAVTICEMVLPAMKAVARQTCLRTAMRTFSRAGGHPYVPMLIDVFRENERDFFVFEIIKGESLLARMQRTKQPLQERELIECSLQLTEVLETLLLIHGLISPEHILMTPNGNWSLSNFSVVLASGASEYFTSVDPSHLSPFTTPELMEGMIDSRLDIYALLTTLYYAQTGKLFNGDHTYRPSSFQAIFQKGFHPTPSQRYQALSELRKDLLSLHSPARIPQSVPGQKPDNSTPPFTIRPRSNIDTLVSVNERVQQTSVAPLPRSQEELSFAPTRDVPDPVSQAFSALSWQDEQQAPPKELLLQPQDLPPMRPGNDILAASLWMITIVLCFLVPVLLNK